MRKFTTYKLLDTYDGIEVIGYADTGKDAYNIFAERMLDTDGECYLSYVPVDTVDIAFEAVLSCAKRAVRVNFEDDCLDIEED